MITVTVLTVIGEVVGICKVVPSIDYALNYVQSIKDKLSDPDAYVYRFDAMCFRN